MDFFVVSVKQRTNMIMIHYSLQGQSHKKYTVLDCKPPCITVIVIKVKFVHEDIVFSPPNAISIKKVSLAVLRSRLHQSVRKLEVMANSFNC